MLKHIKVIQQNELKSWIGLQIQFTQRPGMGNIHTNKKFAKVSEYFKLEDDRFKNLLDLVNRVRDSEEEKMAYTGMSQPLQDKQIAAPGSLAAAQGNAQGVGPGEKRIQEFINFKMPKDLALINRDNMNILCYTKPSQYEQTQFDMFFKMVKADAKLVKAVMETNGLGQTESNEWNVLWTSQSIKSFIYEAMLEHQKINHFPMSNELTRKDRLCENIVKMQERFGKETFNILPDSYILPDEFADFYSHFHSLRSKQQTNMWIIKPQNSSQGKGIYIIDDISEVPIDEHCIISRYVANPFLINGLKFDLRLYVCITSMEPWRIYIYNEGLVRFASEPYDMNLGKGAKYSHLTNFSINKKNAGYVNNLSAEVDDQGHKWSLQALGRHLEQVGVDMNLLWSRIYDVILKSLICVDSQIQAGLKKMTHKNNCFELLGYDVLIDSDLKPWLMEVNLSPSLATESPLDLKIKSQLFIDTMNLISVKKYDRRRDNITKMKNRFKNIMRAKSYQSRQNYPNSAAPSKHGINNDDKNRRGRDPEDWIGDQKKQQATEKITNLNPRFREVLRDSLLESQRKNNFIRIYPTRSSDIYDQYFTQPKQSHKLLYKVLFTDELVPFQTSYPLIPLQRKKHRSDDTNNSNSDKGSNYKADTHHHHNNHLSASEAAEKSQSNTANGRQSLRPQNNGSSNSQTPAAYGNSNVSQQQQVLQQSSNSGSNKASIAERQGAPGSPSKRQPESASHSLSLHPIIPEEKNEGVSGSKVKSAMGAQKSTTVNDNSKEEELNQPYGATRGDFYASKNAHESDRNNSTAKSQKRQDMVRRTGNKFNKTSTPNQSSSSQPASNNKNGAQLSNSTNNSTLSPFPGGGVSSTSTSDNRRPGVLQSTSDLQSVTPGASREKLLITGDDVLIEYVHRLMIAVQSIKEIMLKAQWKHQIEKFIKHYVWHTSDVRRAANNKLWQRLESRLIEMKERRKRLLQNIYLREKNMDTNLPRITPSDSSDQDYSLDFQREYETKEGQKNVIISGFSASQLEEMLRTSTRNVAYEVISCLIDANGRGVLTEIIKFLTISNKHIIEVEENGSSILDNLNKKSHSHYGRHHNYYQNSKYGNKVPCIDESEEDCESYANIHVNLGASNPKKAYQNGGGSSSGMCLSSSSTKGNNNGPGAQANGNSAVNNSSLGSSQHHQVASKNDIRIKIRKNSIEPHVIAKANHKQIMRQRILKEQQQRQVSQISSTAAANQGVLPISDTVTNEIVNELSSKLQVSEKASITPRTTSQRQASRSFKQKVDQSDNGTSVLNPSGFEDSQLSMEELQIRSQKSSDKTPNGILAAKAASNNLFDKSMSRDHLSKNNMGQVEEQSFDQGMLNSLVSKTARCIDSTVSSQGVIENNNGARIPQISAVRVLNRDLIASSENLNDFSPKSSGLGKGLVSIQSSSQQAQGSSTGVSRASNNKSQYLAKYAQDGGNNLSSLPLEGLKDLKIRNKEPRGRLGNFKKGSSNGTMPVGMTNGAVGDDETQIHRKELSGKIPSTSSIQSFQKSTSAAQHQPQQHNQANSAQNTKEQQSFLNQGSRVQQQPASMTVDAGSRIQQQQLMSPGKASTAMRGDGNTQLKPQQPSMHSPAPQTAFGPATGQLFVADLAPQKQLTAHTEKKVDKKSTAKVGKGHVKVIKRNLIQSSDQNQKEPGDQGASDRNQQQQNQSNGHVLGGQAKRSSFARGSSPKSGGPAASGGAKGTGKRQHKF